MSINEVHPDFRLPWCTELLSSPGITLDSEAGFKYKYRGQSVSNAIFERTLFTPSNIRAHIGFMRPSSEPDSVLGVEVGLLMSVGDGIDGAKGRAHGGFNSLVLDQLSGSAAQLTRSAEPVPPATATLNVVFKAPVPTPSVVLCRGWATKVEGRKVWTKAVLEDGKGKVYASCTSLFIAMRSSAL